MASWSMSINDCRCQAFNATSSGITLREIDRRCVGYAGLLLPSADEAGTSEIFSADSFRLRMLKELLKGWGFIPAKWEFYGWR